MKKIFMVLAVILIIALAGVIVFFANKIVVGILAKIKTERKTKINEVTLELKQVMDLFKAEGYITCRDFHDNGSRLSSVKANYYKNGVMRQYYGKFYWLRCNFTSNRPVVIRLKNKRWPDQIIPPLPDWGYIYDDSVAQELR